MSSFTSLSECIQQSPARYLSGSEMTGLSHTSCMSSSQHMCVQAPPYNSQAPAGYTTSTPPQFYQATTPGYNSGNNNMYNNTGYNGYNGAPQAQVMNTTPVPTSEPIKEQKYWASVAAIPCSCILLPICCLCATAWFAYEHTEYALTLVVPPRSRSHGHGLFTLFRRSPVYCSAGTHETCA